MAAPIMHAGKGLQLAALLGLLAGRQNLGAKPHPGLGDAANFETLGMAKLGLGVPGGSHAAGGIATDALPGASHSTGGGIPEPIPASPQGPAPIVEPPPVAEPPIGEFPGPGTPAGPPEPAPPPPPIDILPTPEAPYVPPVEGSTSTLGPGGEQKPPEAISMAMLEPILANPDALQSDYEVLGQPRKPGSRLGGYSS